MFFAYKSDAFNGRREGMFDSPIMVTPCFTTVLFTSLNTQFPPCSTAMSTITDPKRMLFTMSSVTNTGALRPGINAVVITMSASDTCFATNSCWFLRNSSDTPSFQGGRQTVQGYGGSAVSLFFCAAMEQTEATHHLSLCRSRIFSCVRAPRVVIRLA